MICVLILTYILTSMIVDLLGLDEMRRNRFSKGKDL